MSGEQDGSSAVRVLFVCMGNICRSPTAEAVMNHLLAECGLSDRIRVDSAGTIGYHSGAPSDSRARTHGVKRGYRFEHLARRVTSSDFRDFDYIVAMDRENLADLERMASGNGAGSRISLLMSHCEAPETLEVPDPYYGGANGFEQVLDLVECGCRALLERIRRDHSMQ